MMAGACQCSTSLPGAALTGFRGHRCAGIRRLLVSDHNSLFTFAGEQQQHSLPTCTQVTSGAACEVQAGTHRAHYTCGGQLSGAKGARGVPNEESSALLLSLGQIIGIESAYAQEGATCRA